jgi:hypothetical protein
MNFRRKNLHKHPGPPFQNRPGPGYFSNYIIICTTKISRPCSDLRRRAGFIQALFEYEKKNEIEEKVLKNIFAKNRRKNLHKHPGPP